MKNFRPQTEKELINLIESSNKYLTNPVNTLSITLLPPKLREEAEYALVNTINTICLESSYYILSVGDSYSDKFMNVDSYFKIQESIHIDILLENLRKENLKEQMRKAMGE